MERHALFVFGSPLETCVHTPRSCTHLLHGVRHTSDLHDMMSNGEGQLCREGRGCASCEAEASPHGAEGAEDHEHPTGAVQRQGPSPPSLKAPDPRTVWKQGIFQGLPALYACWCGCFLCFAALPFILHVLLIPLQLLSLPSVQSPFPSGMKITGTG